MRYIAESKNVQEIRIKTTTELLGRRHERWQSLELFCWEEEDESGANCGSQKSQAHSIELTFYYITQYENKLQVELKSSKFRMKSPDTCLINYGNSFAGGY